MKTRTEIKSTSLGMITPLTPTKNMTIGAKAKIRVHRPATLQCRFDNKERHSGSDDDRRNHERKPGPDDGDLAPEIQVLSLSAPVSGGALGASAMSAGYTQRHESSDRRLAVVNLTYLLCQRQARASLSSVRDDLGATLPPV